MNSYDSSSDDDDEIKEYSTETLLSSIKFLEEFLDYDKNKVMNEFKDYLISTNIRKQKYDKILLKRIYDMISLKEETISSVLTEFYSNLYHYVKNNCNNKNSKKTKKVYSTDLEKKYIKIHKINDKIKKLNLLNSFLKDELSNLKNLIKNNNLCKFFENLHISDYNDEINKIYTFISYGFDDIIRLRSETT